MVIIKAVILAAGAGNRLLHLTKNIPKCKLKVRGKPIIEHQLEAFRYFGIRDISIVKGFMKEQINYPETKSYYNDDYRNRNILLSLLKAENEFNDDVIVAYSDIIFEKELLKNLLQAEGDVALLIEEDWRNSYDIRKDNSIEEAEKVIIEDGKIVKIGKHLSVEETNGEFIGIAKFTKKGITKLKETYYEVCKKYINKPFQNSPSIRDALLIDILQELIDNGSTLSPVITKGGWIEIDTIGDLKIAGGEITAPKITPEARRGILKKILEERGFVRAIEAHNGISAIIANNAVVGIDKNGFDALWVSSLTESAAKGQPDIEIMGHDSRINTVHQILDVVDKPIIIDGDTGGDPNAFEYFVRKAESLGVSAVVIEDKVYPKRNSLDTESDHILENPLIFANKIRRGKHALLTDDFMIIARIESFIAGKDIDDAIKRTSYYLEAGADGILIHSKSKNPDEIIHFARKYRELSSILGIEKPLVCIPTTYNNIKESELRKEGFNIVIHANHLIRSAIKSMRDVCRLILENERSLEADNNCVSVNEIFDIVGFSDIKNKEKFFMRTEK